MSLRPTPRPADRDMRLHDPHVGHHSQSLPPPPPGALVHTPHINGNGVLAPPGPHPGPPGREHPQPVSQLVSPTVIPSAVPNGAGVPASIQKLAQANEQTWLLIGRVAEQMGNLEHALSAYENALRHNPLSLSGLTQVAGIARIRENYPKAVDYFQRVINMNQDNGEVWSALGHCYLMQDDLQKAYTAYQQALYLLPNPKEDPKLWYGIGILYDRYGSLDHAEEAFSLVLRMDKDFDKANEILFRLGIIYKQQGKYADSLECFDRILRNPPNPLAHADIWFQIGHVFEQQRDHVRARDAYERVVIDNPGHAKVLQQLGWLYHQDGSSFQNQEIAIQYLTKSLEADPSDAQSWYLLGRAYMAGQKYNKAYEAYQQAVYRDGRNPTFWCSIGVLYFQINQYRDALDAYSRAIRINPYISEVWFDLGSLYESCNNQISDAIDAYARAAELDPSNVAIAERLQLLRNAQATGSALPAAPGPQDVHPTAYANPVIPPGLGGPPMLLQPGNGRPTPIFRTDSRGPPGDLSLPLPPHQQQLPGRSSPGPFGGRPPPPVVLDDNRHITSHTPLAPMDVDRPPLHSREPSGPYTPARENGPRGPGGQGLLLHHPVPQQQVPPETLRGSAHPSAHPHDPAAGRYRISPSASPPPHQLRSQSAANGRPPYDGRPPVGPGQTPLSARRSPPPQPSYGREPPMSERDPAWERRIPMEHVEWERRGRPGAEYPPHPSQLYGRAHSPPQRGPSPRRERSPDMSPPSAHPGYSRGYWESRHMQGGPAMPPRSPPPHEQVARRYDPRFDARDPPPREYEPMVVDRAESRYGSPETLRMRGAPQPGPFARTSESPRIQPGVVADPKSQQPTAPRRRGTKDSKDSESSGSAPAQEPAKKERKRRAPPAKRVKEEPSRGATPGYGGTGSYRQSKDSPDPSSNGSAASAGRSVQPSPTGSAPRPPSRHVDENYDEGVAETLLMFHRPNGTAAAAVARPTQESPHHRRASMSSRASPPTAGVKRPLSPAPAPDDRDAADFKRSRIGSASVPRRSPPSNGRPTPPPNRLSPIPFRQQPTSHSPEAVRQLVETRSYSSSPQLPMTLPPHPRPIGAGHAQSAAQAQGAPSGPGAPGGLANGVPLLSRSRSSPTGSAAPSQPERAAPSEEDRDRVRSHSGSTSPMRTKREIVLHQGPGSAPASASGSPPAKGTTSPASSHGRSGAVP